MTVFTRKCQYPLRALYLLGREFGNGPVPASRLAAHANTSVAFLETILLELRNASLLESRRGARGGYLLLVPTDRVTVGSIARLIDGPLVPLAGVHEKQAGTRRDDSGDVPTCEIQLVIQRVHEATAAILDSTTIMSGCAHVEIMISPENTNRAAP